MNEKAKEYSLNDLSLAMWNIDQAVLYLQKILERNPNRDLKNSLDWAINSLQGTIAGPLIDAQRGIDET